MPSSLVSIAFLYPSIMPLKSLHGYLWDISELFDSSSLSNDFSCHQRDAKNQPSFGAGCLSIIEKSLSKNAEKLVSYL